MDPRQPNGRPKPTGISDRKPAAGPAHGSFQRTLASNPAPPLPAAPARPAGPGGMPTTVCGKCGFAVPYMRQFEGQASSCPKCRAPIVLGRAAAPKPSAPPAPRSSSGRAPAARQPLGASEAAPAPAQAPVRTGSTPHQPKPAAASLRPGSATHKTGSSTHKSAGLFGRRPSQRTVAPPSEFKILSNDNQPAEPEIEAHDAPAAEAPPSEEPQQKKLPSKRELAQNPAALPEPKEASDVVVPPDILAKAEQEAPAPTEAPAEPKGPPSKRQAVVVTDPKAEAVAKKRHSEKKPALTDESAPAVARGGKKKLAVVFAALFVLLAAGGAIAWKKKHPSGAASGARTGPGGGGDEGGYASSAAQVRASVADATFQKQRPRSTVNLLLAQTGAVPGGCNNPQFLNDGNSTEFDGGNGYAYHNVKNGEGPMTITLPEPRELTRVRFLLWDQDERTYGYVLSVSPDGKKWNKIKDNTKGSCRSWQEIKFERQKVKVVAVKGTAATADDNIHVVEIEGYDDGAELDKLTPRKPPTGPIKAAVSSLKPGIWAEFFDGCEGYPAVEDKPDLTIARNSLAFGASPGPGLHDWPFAGPCGAIFSGYLKIEKQGLYTFFVQSQNGARLYIDGELLITHESNKLQEVWEQADLSAGLHRIWVEYFGRSQLLGINVSLKQKGESKEFISDKMLLYDPAEVGAADSDGRHAPDAVEETNKISARFLSRNDKRGGAWKNEVGRDGYVIFNKNGGGQHLLKLPPYIASVTSAGEHCVWQVGADPRGLEEPAGGGQRLCSCEYSANDVVIDIRASRGTLNRLSIYVLDFDKLQRHDKIVVMDHDTVLQENDAGDMANGAWMQYEISGPVTIHVQNTGGPNSVVAGLFWDSDKGVKFREPAKGPPPSMGELKPGVVAEYFDGLITYPTEDDAPTFFRLEPTIAFGGTPAAGERHLRDWPMSDVCAALFYGAIKVPQDDKYVFDLESDDGARLYIDGEKVADDDGCHPMKEVECAVDLKAGAHRLWVEYFNAGGQMGLNLFMKRNGKKEPIPKEMLFHE
jgi:RNase P/RNase MRP subunit p29